jgi:putative endonuclease
MNHRTRLGKRGEDIVAGHLTRRGMRILARNFHSRHGELDIVAAREKTVIFVEVKTRIGVTGLNQALGRAQIGRLKCMARIFLRCARLCERDYGFWIVYVVFRHADDPHPRLVILENPF